MALRSRRHPQPPISSSSVPIIYALEDDNPSCQGQSWAAKFCLVLQIIAVLGAVHFIINPEEAKSNASKALTSASGALTLLTSASGTWSSLFAAGCNCNLAVVSLLKKGKPHLCEEYCWDQLLWTPSEVAATPPNKLYGNFERHGHCKEPGELTLKDDNTSLIPRDQSSRLPEYRPLIQNQFRDKEILIIGSSVMKQAFEVLPIVLDASALKVSYEHYAYTVKGGLELIKHCGFEKGKQNCRRDKKTQYPCSCSTVSTLQLTGTSRIRFAWAHGIEFEYANKKQTYGAKYNVVKQPLYSKLAESASAVVLNFGVLPNVLKHDTKTFTNLLQFINQWSAKQKVIYHLTMPQHFATQSPHLTYQDEKLKRGSTAACVANATQRHWTDRLAQETLKGVDMIDLFPMAATQGHLHSKIEGDCNQWCMAYDLFYVFWAVLGVAVKLPTNADGVLMV